MWGVLRAVRRELDKEECVEVRMVEGGSTMGAVRPGGGWAMVSREAPVWLGAAHDCGDKHGWILCLQQGG